jgi:two-component system OmpR family response regulator
MRILIAEDDQVLADGLLRTLRASGAAADHVASGTEADAALLTNTEFDLLILDLGLPRMHGLEVLKRLRARGSAMPVLILTAADSVEERVKGLDYGADDYMAKPFSLQELEARVRALIRRGMGGASSTIKHGPLVYDQAGRVATIDGQMLELSARELGLLEVLLQRAGRLVSKDQLVERLCEWGEEVSNNAIEVYIHRLRKKIEKGPVRIATVRGLGYCLEKIPGVVRLAPSPAGGRSQNSRPLIWSTPASGIKALPARTPQPLRRDPRLDAHAAAAAVAHQPGADLAGGAEHRGQAL